MICKIEKRIPEPLHWMLYQQRIEEARITGQKHVERQYWYENLETGQQYYDLFGCVGWPTEVTDKNDMRPGYIAIVGVIKDHKTPQEAVFQLMAEAESKDIPTLLINMNKLRLDFGYGSHPALFEAWIGDPDRFIATIAKLNEKLKEKNGSDKNAIIIAPPFDFSLPDKFEIYSRSFYSVVADKDNLRFYYGKNEILRNRKSEFKRDDPAILAIGGLVHTLLHSTPWMDQVQDNMFVVEEGI
jgi:hypothetical protein